jgi:hypothetical protein
MNSENSQILYPCSSSHNRIPYEIWAHLQILCYSNQCQDYNLLDSYEKEILRQINS